jgi:hypothetical protein
LKTSNYTLRAKLDHLQFHAAWIKGSDNTVADVLSRIPWRKARKDDIVKDEEIVSVVMIATLTCSKSPMLITPQHRYETNIFWNCKHIKIKNIRH